jgi:hypothetical protein
MAQLTIYSTDPVSRSKVVAAIAANQVVVWSNYACLIWYQGTTFQAIAQGRAAQITPLVGSNANVIVYGSSCGFSATAGQPNNDWNDDALLESVVASMT